MESFSCGSIAFSNEYIREMDGRQVIVSIPKEDVIKLEVHHGVSIEKPILNVIIGVGMIVIGCLLGVSPILGFLSNLGSQQGGFGMIVAFSMPLIVLGVGFILPVFQKRDYLLILTKSGRRKLTIKHCAIGDIVDIGKRFGFVISIPMSS